MPRKLRLEYDWAIHHVMNPGDRKEDIFVDNPDRQSFLETLGQACQKTGVQIHAFCLMGNHFHLVVETPRANLSSGMRRGWCWGPNSFREELLEQIGQRKDRNITGRNCGESDEQKAQRMVPGLSLRSWELRYAFLSGNSYYALVGSVHAPDAKPLISSPCHKAELPDKARCEPLSFVSRRKSL